MDFPSNVLTNVYSLNVSRISWALYEYAYPNQSFSDVKDRDTKFEIGFGNETVGDEPLSQEVVATLRHNGVFFKQKRGDRSLWAFTVSHAEENTPKDMHESTLKALRLSGLHNAVALSGTITPGQLSSDLGLATVKSDLPNDNDESGGGPRRVSTLLKAKSDDEKTSIIYQKFILAVKSSIVTVLVERGDRLSIGPDSCLRFLDTANSPSMVYSGRTALAYDDDAEYLNVGVAWSTSGTLIIFGRSRQATGVVRLSNLLSDDRPGDKRTISDGHTVFMALSGASYEFVGTESQITGSVRADRKEKRSILAWLASCGMHIAIDSLWVYLRAADSPPDHSLPHGRNRDLVLWPARACFTRSLTSPPSHDDVLQRISLGTFVDPLTKVEQWFLGRSARAEAAERRRQEDEEKHLRENRQAESVPVQLDDTAADLITQTGHYLSAQEASGIYPTPPDGMAALTQGSFEAPETGTANTVGAQQGAATLEETIAGHSTHTDALGVDISGKRAQGHDLFGGLDPDMFDTNGLTEADFSFFDEPDDELDHTSIERVLPDVPSEGIKAPPQQSPRKKLLEDVQADTYPVMTVDQTTIVSEKAYAADSHTHNASPGTSTSDGSESSVSEPTSTISFSPDSIPGHTSSEPVHGYEEKPTAKNERSTFKYVSPRNGLRGFDEKYREHGKYAASTTEDLKIPRKTHREDPQTQELPRIGMSTEHSDPSTVSADGIHDLTIGRRSPFPWDSDVLDTSSSESGSVRSAGVDKSSHTSSKKRKRASTVGSDHLATPARSDDDLETSLDDPSHHDTTANESHSHHRNPEDLPEFLDESLADTANVFTGNDQDFIQIAQLVADQKILQNEFLQYAVSSPKSPSDLHLANEPEHFATAFKEALEDIIPGIQRCNLKGLSDLDAWPSMNVSTASTATEKTDKLGQPQLRSRVGKNQVDAFQKTQVPYLSVQRGKDAMEVLPPALYFWEELGLSPVQLNRDVVAYLIYPDDGTVREAASAFLMSMENYYQSCRFGRHTCGTKLGKNGDGLVPMPVSSAEPESVFRGLDRVCESIGTELSIIEADGSNYIIYMVNPFNDEAMLPQMCQSFFQLSGAYAERVDSAPQDNAREVILQVVPINLLVNCDRLTFPPPKAYLQLAFEVYSRCSVTAGEDEDITPPYTSSSAVRLAKPIPRAVNFHLGSRATLPLAHDPCMHLAYSWNCHEQWLGCAWTDNMGEIQWNAVYCLQDPAPDHWVAFSQTVQEILDVTMDMIQPLTTRWRLHLVKDGALQQHEVECLAPFSTPKLMTRADYCPIVWRVHSASIFQQRVTVSLLSIDTLPLVSLASTPFTGGPFPPVHTSTSPETPYDQVPTPENTRPTASTPTASGFTENDPSARLIDIVSETWAMISPISVTDPYLPPTNLARVLTSAYLFKRAGPEDDDGLVSLCVNLVSFDIFKQTDTSSANTKAGEKVLREVLGMYSDLATLARSRGIEAWKRGLLPWHVAAARKGKGAVRRCMRWGPPQRSD